MAEMTEEMSNNRCLKLALSVFPGGGVQLQSSIQVLFENKGLSDNDSLTVARHIYRSLIHDLGYYGLEDDSGDSSRKCICE